MSRKYGQGIFDLRGSVPIYDNYTCIKALTQKWLRRKSPKDGKKIESKAKTKSVKEFEERNRRSKDLLLKNKKQKTDINRNKDNRVS